MASGTAPRKQVPTEPQPENGLFNPGAGGSSGGSSGSSGGSSSGGSSSSGSSSSTPAAPPVDPRIAELESLFRSAYISLWGEPPTEAYVKQAAHSGMNTTEFIQRERMKNDWQFTKAYKDAAKGLFDAIRQMGVA
jgi:hypothetical protein